MTRAIDEIPLKLFTVLPIGLKLNRTTVQVLQRKEIKATIVCPTYRLVRIYLSLFFRVARLIIEKLPIS